MDNTIYYVCKYTPKEIFSGFDQPTERLDPAPANFECAESCTHPNLCGYGKALIEEVMKRDIRRLLLVDCCDVCRRIYDVLWHQGNMEFLFLLSLPHKNTASSVSLLERELQRLQTELLALTGENFNQDKALHAWKRGIREAEQQTITEPHVRLIGAHGGTLLKEMIEQRMPLPVQDDTCTGRRMLMPAPECWSDTAYASALLNQHRSCMRMQFRIEEPDDTAVGTICHTIKFCDYYGFAYRHMRAQKEETLLKIETDCTPQSSGQLHTRIDAFAETIGAGANQIKKSENIHYIAGVDSGSTSTDAVILDREKKIVSSVILPTGAGAASGAEKALAAALESAGLKREDLDAVVTTGYGRETVGLSDASATEITCHAKGAHYLFPDARTVIDIGGQDSKVIRIDENGNVVNFVMNDKCAAGTGRFLDMMAKTLELTLPEMSELGLQWKNEVTISSMCTVFAESEVVSLVADNTAPEDIIHGLNASVAGKTSSLVKRLGGEPAYIMTGGVAQNQGVVKELSDKLGAQVYVPKEAQLCGAIGAALLAFGER